MTVFALCRRAVTLTVVVSALLNFGIWDYFRRTQSGAFFALAAASDDDGGDASSANASTLPHQRTVRASPRDKCAHGTPLQVSFLTCLMNYGGAGYATFTQQLLDQDVRNFGGLQKLDNDKLSELIALIQREDPGVLKDGKKNCPDFWMLFSCLRSRLACLGALINIERIEEFKIAFMRTFARCNELNAEKDMTACASHLYRNSTCQKEGEGESAAAAICKNSYFACRAGQLTQKCPDANWRTRLTFCQLDTYLVGECLVAKMCAYIRSD